MKIAVTGQCPPQYGVKSVEGVVLLDMDKAEALYHELHRVFGNSPAATAPEEPLTFPVLEAVPIKVEPASKDFGQGTLLDALKS
jgi:hypothetical protein